MSNCSITNEHRNISAYKESRDREERNILRYQEQECRLRRLTELYKGNEWPSSRPRKYPVFTDRGTGEILLLYTFIFLYTSELQRVRFLNIFLFNYLKISFHGPPKHFHPINS